jgi:hypothetical protein
MASDCTVYGRHSSHTLHTHTVPTAHNDQTLGIFAPLVLSVLNGDDALPKKAYIIRAVQSLEPAASPPPPPAMYTVWLAGAVTQPISRSPGP